MSITGSGAHGIIASMPLYAAYKVHGYSEEALLRATALSYLVCMYIKEYSGKLSAFCGCAIAAGTGMACGLALLRGGNPQVMEKVISNMAGSITGMICDGGNQGYTMKGIVASRCRLCGCRYGYAGRICESGTWNSWKNPRRNHAQYGPDYFTRHDWDRKNNCGNYAGEKSTEKSTERRKELIK